MRHKKFFRNCSRIISLLLILAMLTNDFLGTSMIVLAAEEDNDLAVETETTEELVTDETISEEELEVTPEETFEEEMPEHSEENVDLITEEIQEELVEEEITDEADFLAEDEPQEVLTLGEDIEQRSSNIKYFQNEDHSYTAAIYASPVHYQEDGQWKEIDNTLTDGEAEEGVQFLENKDNLFKVKFAKKSNGSKLVDIKLDDFKISWDLKGADKVNAQESEVGIDRINANVTATTEEPLTEDPTEEVATILTESPAAANSGVSDLETAERLYGNEIKDKPENNASKGILPEEQEGYQDSDPEGIETLDAAYYEKIQEKNDEKMKVDKLSSAVIYPDIYPEVDVEYVLSSQRLKENIILKSADAQNEFIFQMKVNGLELIERDGQILFQDGEGETIFEIQKPYAYDANGEFTDKVSMVLTKGNGKKSELTVSIDQDWLADENRVFPVVLDPVVQTSQKSLDILDTYALSGYPTTNYYSKPYLKTGVHTSLGAARTFIRFTLPELKAGDMVVDAALRMWCYTTGTEEATVGAYEIWDTTWTSQSVTWQTMPVCSDEVEDYITFLPEQGYPEQFNITQMVKNWYEQDSNGGVMLRALQEDGQYVEYVSADYAADFEGAPTVLIRYINNAGLEDYWTYHEQSVGRAGTGYINDYNGNLVFVHQTASTSGNRMPVALSHVYNTNEQDQNLGYGYGWRLNYQQTIKLTKTLKEGEEVDCYEYVDEDGTYHYFEYDNTKKEWKDSSGIDLKLTVDTTASEKYIIKDKKDNQLIFDDTGKLINIKDRNGNELAINYTGTKISSITDGVGRVISCTYDPSGQLSMITSPWGSKSFAYNNKMLTSITDVDEQTISFTYNDKRAMTSVQNIDGYKIVYDYNIHPYQKVNTVTEYAGTEQGRKIDIFRYNSRSCFSDNQGNVEDYAFNNLGCTVSIKNAEGYAQSYKFFTEGESRKKLSNVSKLQSTVANLLKNPNLESNDYWNAVVDGGTVTRTYNSSKARESLYSYHIVSSSVTGTSGVEQSVTLEAGKTYTFSTYVKPETAPEGVSEQEYLERFKVKIEATTTSGTILSDTHDQYETENGWYRLITTIRIPEETSVTSASVYAGAEGVADGYFDCFQLVRGESAGRFNLIVNGDFSYTPTASAPVPKFSRTGFNMFDRIIENSSDYDFTYESYRKGTVTQPVVNMRSGAGTSHSIVTTVEQGTTVVAVGEGKDSDNVTWYYTYVVKDGIVYSGYMISSYISFSGGVKTNSITAMVDAINLNIRQGAGTSNTVLVTVPRNTQVQILDTVYTAKGQAWDLIYVVYGGTKYIGYALSTYIYWGYMGTAFSWDKIGELDTKVLQMVGNPAGVKKVTQTLNIHGKAYDVFMGNLWANGYPAILKDGRTFGMEVKFVYTDDTTQTFTSNFESDSPNWQFLNEVFIPKQDYKKAYVSIVYNYNCNSVIFDGLAFYREDFSQSYTYDDDGNIISVKNQAAKNNTFEYDNNDNLTKMIDPSGSNYTYSYDSSHNVIGAVTAAGVNYTFEYDTNGNPIEAKIVDSDDSTNFMKSTATYSSDGNYQISVTDTLGNTVENSYDTSKGLITKTTDAKDQETEYTYDGLGRLSGVSVDVSDGVTDGNIQNIYGYENDNLKSITHNGYQYTFGEDGFGNPTTMSIAGTEIVSRTYEDYNGKLISETYANGFTYLYEYDDQGRISEIRLKNSEGTEYDLYRYEYDHEGNLSVEYDIREDIGNGTIVTRYFYDLSGRLAYTRTDEEESYRYVYDDNNNLEKSIQKNLYRTIEMEYTYDSDNRETSVNATAKTFSTVYDPLGRVTSKTWDTTVPFASTYTYKNGVNGSKSIQVEKITNGDTETHYTYDPNCNITSITTDDATISYSYDELDQLIREDHSSLGKTIVYVYDLGGNLKEKRIYDYQPSASDDVLAAQTPEDIVIYTYDATWKDKLLSYDGESISYDMIGNPLTYRGMNLTWEKVRELGSLTKDGTTYTYRYNKDGMRSRKILPDGIINYQSEGNLLVGEWKINTGAASPSYELEYLYDSSGNVVAMLYNGTEYYYVKNLQGDIVGIIDETGMTVVTYKYDSWGKLLEIGGNNQTLGQLNPFRYRGYYYDNETGFYYVSSRYYDPEVGRFISADTTDTIGVSSDFYDKNLYAYCDNNPISREDMSGESWTIVGKFVVGAAVNIVTTMIAAEVTGQQYTLLDGFAAGVAGGLGAVIKNKGALVNGILTGAYAAYSSYKSGANVDGIILAAGTAFLCASIDFFKPLEKIKIDVSDGIKTVVNASFGVGSNSISASVYKGVTYNKKRVETKNTVAYPKNNKKATQNKNYYASTRDKYFAGAYTYQIVGYVF